MAREIFSNAAVTRLAQSISATDLVLTVESTEHFPTPVVGQEFFHLTVAGACNNDVEVMRAIEICGENCIRVDQRGAQGTTAQAFSPGDMAYHSLTSGAAQLIMDRFQWYLGPFDFPPSSDNEGFPLQEGHIYWDSVNDIMMSWDGEKWVPFNPLIAATVLEKFTWVDAGILPGGVPLPFPDIYGNAPGDWDIGTHGIEVYLNGNQLIQTIFPETLVGDFTVDYVANTITLNNDVPAGDAVVATVLLSTLAGEQPDYIERGETDASGFGFVDSDPTLGGVGGGSNSLVPTQQAVRTLVDNRVTWRNRWSGQEYPANHMVVDGSYLAVSNKTTSTKPAPIPTGPAENGIENANWALDANAGAVVIASNDFTMNTAGIIKGVHLAPMDPNFISSYIVRIFDLGGVGLLYQRAKLTVIQNNEVEWDTPDLFVATGQVIRVEVELEQATSPAQIDAEAGRFPGTLPSWASAADGNLNNGADVGVSTTAYGVDLKIEPTDDLSPDWDIVPLGGSGGSGGSGGGAVNYVGTSPPSDAVGKDGDLFFIPIES